VIALTAGLLIWIAFAAAALKFLTIRPPLHVEDRLGAAAFFTVVGLPFLITGLALIVRAAA
jgi:hypothetical protein